LNGNITGDLGDFGSFAMPMKRGSYEDVRGSMRTGDVIAYGGRGFVCCLTKRLTESNVSHVGIVVQTRLRESKKRERKEEKFDNLIVESTKRGNRWGVVVPQNTVRRQVSAAMPTRMTKWTELGA
jgi:hypothetical protein